MGLSKLLALLLLPAYMFTIAILDLLEINYVFEPGFLLPVTNTLFAGLLPIVVAYIAARVYLVTGSSSIMFMGCGMFTFGLAAIFAGWLIGVSGGPNINVTIYNMGALAGSSFHTIGAFLYLRGPNSPTVPKTGKLNAVAAYAGVLGFMALFSLMVANDLVHPFFIQEIGPTALRQVVLGTAVFLYILSSIFFMLEYLKWKFDFFYWYSLSLALLAIGLFAFFVQSAVGSPLGWVGRSANYFGGIFSLIAVLKAVRVARSKSLPLEESIAIFFSDAESSYKTLVEAASDAIISFDQEDRIIGWNASAANMFGHTKGEAVGSSFFELVIPETYVGVLKKDIELVIARSNTSPLASPLEIQGKRSDGSPFPVEISVSVREMPTGRVSTCIVRDITERKQNDDRIRRLNETLELRVAQRTADLRESEEKYRLLVENSYDIIFTLNAEGIFTFVSPAWTEMLGHPIDQLIGQPFQPFVHVEDILVCLEFLQKVFNTEQKQDSVEYRVKHISGEWRWYRANAIPLKDEAGKVIGLQGIGRDITEGKRAERRQYLASEILGILNDPSTLTDSIKLILDVIKRETGFDAVGIRLRSGDDFPYFVQSGFSQDFLLTENTLVAMDAIGSPCRDENGNTNLECTCGLVLSGQTDPTNPLFTEGGSSWTNNSLLFLDLQAEQDPRLHPRTTCIHQGYLSVALIPIRANREIVGLLQLNDRKKDCFTIETIHFFEGISTSIGVALLSKQAEETLRISEEKFSKAFFLSPDAIVINRFVDGVYVSVNEGFEQILGYTEDEVIGKSALELNVWDNPEDRNRLIEALKADGKVANFEARFRTKDGDTRYGLMSAAIIELNGVYHILNVTRDITERVRAEEEKESLRSQLLQAQKMEAIGTLAGGVAHDFNNLLQITLGYSELLLNDKNPEHQDYDKLHKINATANRGADLVQRLMVFSRKGDIKPRSLNLNHEVTEAKKLLERIIPKMIAIELSLEGNLPVINADPVQVEQILLNLAINAKDAMLESGGKLTIETRNITLDEEYCRMHLQAKPGRYVMLSVEDTGHGMSQDTAQHIFEPFFTTKGVGKGTGLGLAMVYGIMKHHEGFINCYSELGHGTTFRLYFPVVSKEIEENSEQESAVPLGGSETILLVDDEEFLCDMGSQILTRAGYTVLTANNGNEALDLYRNQKSDISLVLLDLIMPEMGGKECFQKLVNIDPKVKVILFSGFLFDGAAEDATVLGVKGLVGKPYNTRQLLGMVRQVLDGD